MWDRFQSLWNDSLPFRLSLILFAVGVLVFVQD